MGHSQAAKAASREKILSDAAAQLRAFGPDAVSVGPLMKLAGMTHGGFYRHFASRSDMIAQALERALTDGEARARGGGETGKPRDLTTIAKSYLSRAHRDAPETGCGIAALVSDVARADEASRDVMSNHVEAFIAAVDAALGKGREADAMLAVSAMVGALTLSRVLTDAKRSDALLRAVKEAVIALEA